MSATRYRLLRFAVRHGGSWWVRRRVSRARRAARRRALLRRVLVGGVLIAGAAVLAGVLISRRNAA